MIFAECIFVIGTYAMLFYFFKYIIKALAFFI